MAAFTRNQIKQKILEIGKAFEEELTKQQLSYSADPNDPWAEMPEHDFEGIRELLYAAAKEKLINFDSANYDGLSGLKEAQERARIQVLIERNPRLLDELDTAEDIYPELLNVFTNENKAKIAAQRDTLAQKAATAQDLVSPGAPFKEGDKGSEIKMFKEALRQLGGYISQDSLLNKKAFWKPFIKSSQKVSSNNTYDKSTVSAIEALQEAWLEGVPAQQVIGEASYGLRMAAYSKLDEYEGKSNKLELVSSEPTKTSSAAMSLNNILEPPTSHNTELEYVERRQVDYLCYIY